MGGVGRVCGEQYKQEKKGRRDNGGRRRNMIARIRRGEDLRRSGLKKDYGKQKKGRD
jgi:hypothetical protein